ncbi:tetratricopeptide repeat protein [Novilysobacter erysipheiresistens]|uniref:Tetratricopeptide repeat protein n=1 Tax=Novilysobacter erysipheiresistens TaxID=1749332 RepID=A0ABU7Z1K1_9GAMM
MRMLTWAMVVALAMSGSIPDPAPPVWGGELLSAPAPVAELPEWDEVVAVPPSLRAQLDTQVLQHSWTSQQRMRRIVEFMLDPDGLALRYDLDTTRTVAETFRDRQGNCVSFTLTFVALAREAGLDAYVQEADEALVWLQGGGMMFYAGHVNAGVRIGGRRYVVDFERNVVATSTPPEAISDQRALSHWYNNRGAERLMGGDIPGARSLLEASVELEPDFVPAWNNLGVLRLRSGEPEAAERAYLVALEHKPEHVPTLSNLTGLYQQLGEKDELARYQRKLRDVQRSDPYRNFVLGFQHESQGDNAQALAYYERAIGLHGREPRFFIAAARIHTELGHLEEAERSLQRARALSGDSDRDISRTGFRVRR